MHDNPYNFGPITSQSITSKSRFTPRDELVEEIRYYLELSKNGIYFNLLITGPDGSGKTSLLNILKHDLENEFLFVDVDVIETNINDNLLFFYEILDAINESVYTYLTFNKKSGEADGLMKKFTASLKEINITFGVNLLGIASAEISRIGQKEDNEEEDYPARTSPAVLRVIFREYLKKMRDISTDNKIKSIILLFDDCEILMREKPLLEAIRAVFSKLDGYNLIFSGVNISKSDAKIFSPIVSMKLDYINKNSYDIVEKFITDPLNDEEKHLINDQLCKCLLELSHGCPRLIMFFAHYLYRDYKNRYLENRNKGVERLDLENNKDVLTALRSQIEVQCVMPNILGDVGERIERKITVLNSTNVIYDESGLPKAIGGMTTQEAEGIMAPPNVDKRAGHW